MTFQAWSYEAIMSLPEDVRKRFVSRCEEHHERIEDEINSSRRGQ